MVSLALERWLKRVEEGKKGEELRCSGDVREGLVSLVFTWDVDRKSGSAHPHNIWVLDVPKSMNPSHSRIWPNTSDSSSFTFYFIFNQIKY